MTRLLIGVALLLTAGLVVLGHGAPVAAATTLRSVAVTERVAGGDAVTVTVTLGGSATAATRVALTSSDRAALPTPRSITVATGARSATVTVTSAPVARSTGVTVTATLGDGAKTDKVVVLPPALASVSLPAVVGTGFSATGTVRLTGPAPTGGILVALASDRPSRATAPASVRVAAGRATATFPVTTAGTTEASVVVTGTLGVKKAVTIRLSPVRLALSFDAQAYADVPIRGTVSTVGTNPGGALVVALTTTFNPSDAPSAPVALPATVTIPAGRSSATFAIRPFLVGGDDVSDGAVVLADVAADPDDVPARRGLRVSSTISTLELGAEFPGQRPGGASTGVVRLRHAYPADVDVALTMADPGVASAPATVRVPAGRTSATFRVRVLAYGATTLTATYRSSASDAVGVQVGPNASFYVADLRVGLDATVRLFSRPLPYDVTYALASSDPGVASIRSSVTVRANRATGNVDVPVTLRREGTVTFTATFDGVDVATTFAVRHLVDRIELLDPPTLGPLRARITIGDPAPRDLAVTLSSNSAAVVVPAQVTVRRGTTSAAFTLTIAAGGSAQVSAGFAGIDRTVTISTGVYVSSVTISGAYIGAETLGRVTLSGDVAAATVVELSAVDPSVVTVPATVTVAAGSDDALFPITGIELGTTTVSARVNGYPRSATVTTAGLIASVEAADAMVGLPATVRVTIAAPQRADVEIRLASGTASVATVPGTVVLPADASAVEVPVAVLAVGRSTITASVAGVERSVELVAVDLFASLNAGADHAVGGADAARLSLARPAPSDVSVALASSDPAVATVPATVTVPEGERTVDVPVASLAPGTTVITASRPGSGAITLSWTVVTPLLASVTVSGDAYVGLEASGVVALSGRAEEPVVVLLREGSGDRLTVPASVTVPAGETTAGFSFTARRVGETDIRASVDGSYHREAPVRVLQIVGDLTLPTAYVGEAATGTLALAVPAPRSFEVQVDAAYPEVATVPAAVTVAEGSASVAIPITPVGPGTTQVTVAFTGIEVRATLTVADRPTLAGLAVPPLSAGTAATGQVQLSPAPTVDTVVALASSSADVATVPATVAVPAGEAYGSFMVTAVGTGTTTITATLDGVSLSQEATVGGFVADIDPGTLVPLVEGQQVTVTFAGPAQGPLTLGVSSDAAIVTAPNAVGVGTGDTGVAIPVTVSGSGVATITVSLNGQDYAEAVTVSPLLAGASCACPVVEGRGASAEVRLAAAPSGPFNVLLSSSDAAVASVPAGILVEAGATSSGFTVTAGAPGSATITASWNGESVAFAVEVQANALSATGPAGPIAVGATDETAWVALAVAPADWPVEAAVAVGDAAIVGAPATVTIPAGSTGAPLALTGLAPGTTTVTVSWGGQTASFAVVVE